MKKKTSLKILNYLIFLGIGVWLFLSIYKKDEFDWTTFGDNLSNLKIHWIIISLILNMIAQLSRTLRWKMLIKPLGYNPSTSNVFLSVFVMYGVNFLVPRAGEIARCTVISRTDKVPFTKLIGTVFTERLADVVALFILAIAIFLLNFELITGFFQEHNPIKTERFRQFLELKYILLAAGMLVLLLAAYLYLRRRLRKSSKRHRLRELKNQLIAGISSIRHMKKKWLFIFHTANIFLMWLLMLYAVFLAFEPTENVSLRVGMIVFLLGGLVMIIPVQGGIGIWHYTVAMSLAFLMNKVNDDKAMANYETFALIAHAVTNLIYIVLGSGALLFFWYKYGRDFLIKPANKENPATQ